MPLTPSHRTTVKVVVGTATASSVALIPPDAVIMESAVDVTTAYSVGATIDVGHSTDADLVHDQTELLPLVASLQRKVQRTDWGGAALAVQVTIGGSPSVGACTVYVTYTEPVT